MHTNILIVGGYGAVGQIIVKELYPFAQRQGYQLLIAGRNIHKAQQLAQQYPNSRPCQLDIQNDPPHQLLRDDVRLVIMCLDQKNTNFVEYCIKNSILYIDITANYQFMQQLQALAPLAIQRQTTILTSVGLAPGVSNLLVRYCLQRVSTATYANIHILLGLGEQHGEAAFNWTLDHFDEQYTLQQRMVQSLSDPQIIKFPAPLGSKITYRFNFSDQHTLPASLCIPHVNTRISFEYNWATRLFATMRWLGVGKLFRYPRFRNIFKYILDKFPLGSSRFAVLVEVGDEKYKNQSCVSGNGEGEITGVVAALVAQKLLSAEWLPKGIFNIESLDCMHDILAQLPTHGYEWKE